MKTNHSMSNLILTRRLAVSRYPKYLLNFEKTSTWRDTVITTVGSLIDGMKNGTR